MSISLGISKILLFRVRKINNLEFKQEAKYNIDIMFLLNWQTSKGIIGQTSLIISLEKVCIDR